jgi:sugar-phosphatase
MIQAIIFDMDGLLIDSEPQWRVAELEVFAKVGVPLTEDMTHQTTGLRTDAVVDYWFQRFPWQGQSQTAVIEDLNATALRCIVENAEVLPGVYEILSFFEAKALPLAVASSSSMKLIEAVLEKLKIRHLFSVVHSGTLEMLGKPDPAVYLTTARQLGIAPQNCLAWEDSVNGMRAAIRAGMPVIAVPAPENYHLPDYQEATLKLASLVDFNESLWKQLQTTVV